MESVRFDRVVSVNSETKGHEAKQLLQSNVTLNSSWLCEKGTEKGLVILKLERSAVITKIDIGNAHSAFVEILVGRSADAGNNFQTLIPTSSFMTPYESKSSQKENQVRFFASVDFDPLVVGKSWDLIKIVCSQPFNKLVCYGLCFIKVHGQASTPTALPLRQTEEIDIPVGAFFRKRKEIAQSTKTISEKIREAETSAALATHTPVRSTNVTPKLTEKLKTPRAASDPTTNDSLTDNRKNREIGLDESIGEGASEQRTSDKKRKLIDAGNEGNRRQRVEEKTLKSKKKEFEKNKRKAEKEQEEVEKTRDKEKDMPTPKRKREKKVFKDEDARKPKKKKGRPFNKLMEDVVVVLSGFQNPHRGTYRSKALEMGARYSADWVDGKCTHLVAAFINTPKCNQVKGKGKIVSKDWLEKCYTDKKRYPWRRFALDKKDRDQPESEEEIDVEAETTLPRDEPTTSSSSQHISLSPGPSTSGTAVEGGDDSDYYLPTEDEDEIEEESIKISELPLLPNYFEGKVFHVDENLAGRTVLERYIIAYSGKVVRKLNDDVHYYITSLRGPPLNILRKSAKNFIPVSATWIQAINFENKYLPSSDFEVD